MHSLRHAARIFRGNNRLISPTGGMHESHALSISRAYSAKEVSYTRQHKTKEERRVLVLQFVEKYKASNEGKLPGITVLRKEVGGSTPILKEILQELEKEQSLPNTVVGTSEHDSILRMDEKKGDLVTHKKKKKLTGTDASKKTEGLGAEAPTVDACSVEQDIPKPMKILATNIVEVPESSEKMKAFPSVEPDKAVAEGETTKEKTRLEASEEKTIKQEENVGAPRVDAGHLLVDSSQSANESDNESGLLPGYIGVRQRLSQDSFHTADDADDDSDLAAPEYSAIQESSSQELLQTLDEATVDSDLTSLEYNEERKTSSVKRLLDNSSKLSHPPRFELFLRSLPAFVTSEALLRAFKTFKDCGKIVSARVFASRGQMSKNVCGIVKFETAQGLHAARMIEIEVVNNLVSEFKQKQRHQETNATGVSCPNSVQEHDPWGSRRSREMKKPSVDAGCDSELTVVGDLSGVLHKAEPQGHLNPFSTSQKSFGVRVQAVPPQINTFEMKEAMAHFGDIMNVSKQRVRDTVHYVIWFKTEEAAKKAFGERKIKLRDSWYHLGRQASPLTTVVRLSNVSSQVTPSKLKSTCETIANVAGLEMRKAGIVDVQFHVKDTTDMINIIERLSKLKFGEQRLRVYPAPRFFCGKDPNNHFKPQDVQDVKKLKDTALKQVEWNMEKLSTELQDFRELLALKQSNMLEAYTKSLI